MKKLRKIKTILIAMIKMKTTRKVTAIYIAFLVLVSVFVGCSKDVELTQFSTSTKAGDVGCFGQYEQDNHLSNGKEKIAWRVLTVEDGKAFLLADKILDAKPYNTDREDVTWENCTLRTWLNDDFYNAAFNSAEQAKILTTDVVNGDNQEFDTDGGNNTKDKVFLLSYSEVTNPAYGFNSDCFYEDSARQAQVTDLAKSNEIRVENYGNSYWWLRSPGYNQHHACNVYDCGDVYAFNYVYDVSIGARPALWINLSETIKDNNANVKASTQLENMTVPATTEPTSTTAIKTTKTSTTEKTETTVATTARPITISEYNKDFLCDFLVWWHVISDGKEYDATSMTDDEVASLMMVTVVGCGDYCYHDFWSNKGYQGCDNGDSMPLDPLNEFPSAYYSKYDAANVDWIMKNIFNVTPVDEGEVNGNLCFYKYEGYYYASDGPCGGTYPTVEILKITPLENGDYSIEFQCMDDYGGENVVGKATGIIRPKTIDGRTYMSIFQITWNYYCEK